jgi:hypothetical protein
MRKQKEKIPTTIAFLCHLPTKKKQKERETMRLVQGIFWKNWSKVVMFQGKFLLKLPFLDHPI